MFGMSNKSLVKKLLVFNAVISSFLFLYLIYIEEFPRPEILQMSFAEGTKEKDPESFNYTWYRSASKRRYALTKELPNVKVKAVNCTAIFSGSQTETQRALKYQYERLVMEKDDPRRVFRPNFVKVTKYCRTFRARRGYLMRPVSAEEEDFPLAFAIVIYKDVEQVERLLRAVYRPQNFYCIHVDKKASATVLEDITSIVRCFPNMFILPQRIDVHWGYFSVVEPELLCIDQLVKYKKWKYFINLTGQEFPLKTNLDLVKILKVFQGANAVAGELFTQELEARIHQRTTYVWKEGEGKTNIRKEPFRHNMTMVKGQVHTMASRPFLEYVSTDPVALEFREWCRDTGHGSEHFYNSLEYSPQLGVPGAYTGRPDGTWSPNVLRWKMWADNKEYRCQGKHVRNLCIVGVGDLPSIRESTAAFVNKLHVNYNPLAYGCLEELHFQKTRGDILGRRDFDVKFYSELDIVQDRLHVLADQREAKKYA